jgi:hypothetical protein
MRASLTKAQVSAATRNPIRPDSDLEAARDSQIYQEAANAITGSFLECVGLIEPTRITARLDSPRRRGLFARPVNWRCRLQCPFWLYLPPLRFFHGR